MKKNSGERFIRVCSCRKGMKIVYYEKGIMKKDNGGTNERNYI